MIPNHRKDITGERIGSLTAVRRVGVKSGHTYWEFRCDCGTVIERTAANVRKNKNQSCAECQQGPGSWAWKGVGEIPQSYYRTLYHGAQARSLEFTVTIDELWQLFVEQDRRCAMTGWELRFTATYATKGEQTASLDRIDSSIGYVPGNLQWLHRDVNWVKKALPDERFIEICRAVAEHRATSAERSTTP
ncbi:hypothetical protein ACWEQ4_00935 [Rhodococcus sp. NPDC003994]